MIPRIHTVTGNLLWEKTLTFDSWASGKTQRATGQTFQVGGKGINVSRMLTRLGIANTAVFFSGGATGQQCVEWLQTNGIDSHPLITSTETRMGIVVRSGHQEQETTFLGPDASPDVAAVKACADYVASLPPGDVVALCGSFPGWSEVSFEPVRTALLAFSQRGTLAVDTYGAPLDWATAHAFPLVKINWDEFSRLRGSANRPTNSRTEEIKAAALESPVRRWIITDGAKPVWFLEKGDPPATLSPPPVHEISATGSGDVLFAALLVALFIEHRSMKAALEFALPYGAANAAAPGIAEFSLERLPSIG